MLPTEKTKAIKDFAQIILLIYGITKIGKSTFASHFPGALFLATEPGLDHLETYQIPIKTWRELLQACREIAEGKHEFKTIIIDTIDSAYRLCADHILEQRKVEHESDMPHGKAYDMIEMEFHRVMYRLAKLPYGLIMISHSEEKEIETDTGKTYIRTVPSLQKRGWKVVSKLVSNIVFATTINTADSEGKRREQRVIMTRPNSAYIAGGRHDIKDAIIPLNFESFKQAFENAGKEE